MSSAPDTKGAAKIEAESSKYAADLQRQSSQEQMALQREMYDKSFEAQKEQEAYNRGITSQNQQNAQPFITEGNKGLSLLSNTVTDPNSWYNKQFTGENLQNDPGYQFRAEQGNKALNNSLAAGSGLLSGAAAKAAASYNQGLASQEFQNAYARDAQDKATRMGGLQALTNYGVTGNQLYQSGSNPTNWGNNITTLNTNNAAMTNGINQNMADNLSNIAVASGQRQANYLLSGQKGFNASGALSGAASMYSMLGGAGAAAGAAKGSALGPWGALAGGIIGGLSSYI